MHNWEIAYLTVLALFFSGKVATKLSLFVRGIFEALGVAWDDMTSFKSAGNDTRCRTCDMEFPSAHAADVHWELSGCRFRCTLCPNKPSYDSDQGLKDHWKVKHTRLYCSACEKVCINRRALRDHECVKSYRCDPCRMSFLSDEALECHFRVHHIYVKYCYGCDQTYRAWYEEDQWHDKKCFGPKHEADRGNEDAADSEEQETSTTRKKQDPQSKENVKYCSGCRKMFYTHLEADEWHNVNCLGGKHGADHKNEDGTDSREDERPNTKKQESPNGKEKPKSKRKQDPKTNEKSKTKVGALSQGIPRLYDYLKVHPLSSHEAIAQAARKRRVEVHPDKLRRPGMTDLELDKIDEIAMNVGWAADILLDSMKRAQFDRELRQHAGRTR